MPSLPSERVGERARHGGVLALFTLTTLLSATLLFLVQPMIAKMVLPLLGGAPAVWNTCMLFFQAALLLGYAYAHVLTRALRSAGQLAVHALVLGASCALLPIGLRQVGAPQPGAPVWWLLGALALSVGGPFFALATTGPLLQRWFAATRHPHAHDPYFLYSASNLGSLAALLAYPLALEPALPLVTPGLSWSSPRWIPASQSLVWSAGFVVLAVLMVACGLAMLRHRAVPAMPVEGGAGAAGGLGRRALWVLLAFVPSSAMLGATQHLTSDIAAVPLLWVLPLCVYLLTFVLAYARRPWISLRTASVGLALLLVAQAAAFWFFDRPWAWLQVPLHLLALFAVGMVCHGRLAALRPSVEGLTPYYLLIALGGVLGGVFNALVAPVIFDSVLEYPLILVLACLLRPGAARADEVPGAKRLLLDVAAPVGLALLIVAFEMGTPGLARLAGPFLAVVKIGIPCALCLMMVGRRLRFALGIAVLLGAGWILHHRLGETLHAERSFFGVHRVTKNEGPPLDVLDPTGKPQVIRIPFHALLHGTTRHGTQFEVDPLRQTATGYYHSTSLVGQVFRTFGQTPRLDRVGVIGLGAGTLAAYGRPGQSLTFYEIDPAVARIAGDPALFTYLRDSRAAIRVVIGDGRLSVVQEPDGGLGLLVVDAFSSDAIPVHLVTREAVSLYFRKLAPDGLLALHLTNQFIDLRPVLSALAADLGLVGVVRTESVRSLSELVEGKEVSTWAVLARSRAMLRPIDGWEGVELLPEDPRPDRRYLWTDTSSNLLRVLKLR